MYNNIIVTESYANIRAMARKALSGKWMIFSFGMFIFMLLSALIPSFWEELYIYLMHRFTLNTKMSIMSILDFHLYIW